MTNRPYLEGKANKEITEGLTQVLADTFILYFKTHSFHWNVVGPRFRELHELFEEQYTEMWEATDEIAERIRVLKEYAPNSFKDLQNQANLNEVGQTPDAKEMTRQLANDNRTIVDHIYPVLRKAEEAGDEVTVDMLIQRAQIHEENAWMLESINKE